MVKLLRPNADAKSYETSTLECYLKGTNYTLVKVDIETDKRSQQKCSKYNELFFKRHCIASVYLEDTDWMLIVDADTGVINPNHCIEEWIDDRVDVILYERFFNWEISAASFMQYVLDILIPDAIQARENCKQIWHQAKDYDSYMIYVSCVKQAIGATRLWPGKIRIYRKAHAWVRDGFLTNSRWYDGDFMLHGWKGDNLTDDQWKPPLSEIPDLSLCGPHLKGWHWKKGHHVDAEAIRELLDGFEKHVGNTYPKRAKEVVWLTMPDIGACFPDCDKLT
ncbi:unnamed protein product [Nippostrongylus brasiliensis]|uniref:Glycosyltransferase n=1 Tax=Nippostrongylus brasiliensis TaxID=27835 RepID=A0A0N4YMP5_NIPBR|nr:unnamed protein product [Nippostrongylus brasiliensis]